MSFYQRLLLLSSAAGVLALLFVARGLAPSGTGYGTHQQLGLPACASIVLFGGKCLACGMTTAWSLATRWRLAEACEANVGGLLLAIIALAYVPFVCYFCYLGRYSRDGWLSWSLAVGLTIALGASICQWVVRLVLL